MKFNKAELSVIAQDPSHNFNKEGILEFLEKQEGFFKTTEVRAHRWCRLRGNLLFYFQSQDYCSDPVGVIVLENCYLIEEDQNGIPNSFTVVYDENRLTLGAPSLQEKYSWIGLMQRSSIAYMRREINSMIRKIQHAKPSLPITIESYRSTTGTVVDLKKPPFLELCISCDNLRCDGKGMPPNPRVSVFVLKPPQEQWILYAQTEILEHTSNPNFSSTIAFRESDGLDPQTRVCLIVCDIKDRISDTSIHLGKTMMTIQSIMKVQQSEKTRLYLLSPTRETIGFITLTSWSLDAEGKRKRDTMSHQTPDHMRNCQTRGGHRRTQSLPPVLGNDVISPPDSALSLLCANPVVSTFRFHSGLGGDISVSEIMAEPNIVFEFPQQLLKLWIQEEHFSRDEIYNLGRLTDEWTTVQANLLTQHSMLISLFEVAWDTLKQRELLGVYYRKSIEKTESTLEFAPINLHVHRFCAANDSLRHFETYDTITVGAFSANSLGFNKGGLQKLHFSLNQSRKDRMQDKAATCYEALTKIRYLRREIGLIMNALLSAINERNCDRVLENTHRIHEKIFVLRRMLCPKLVTEALNFLDSIRLPDNPSNITLASKCHSLDLQDSVDDINETHSLPIHPEKPPNDYKTFLEKGSLEDLIYTSSETCYKSTDEPEPWDLIQLNIKASIICLCSKVKSFCDKYANELNTKEVCVHELTNLVRNDSGIFQDRSPSVSQDACSNHSKDCAQTLFSSCFLTPDPSPCDEENLDKTTTRQFKNLNAPEKVISIESFSYPSQASRMPSPSVSQLRRASGNDEHPVPKPVNTLSPEEGLEWFQEVTPSLKKLGHAIDSLVRTARLTHSLFRLQDPAPRAELKHTIKYRESICFSQALTSVVTGLLTKLWCGKIDSNFLWILTTIGPIVEFEGLLSFHSHETQRIGDMVVAVRQLADVEFVLVAGGTLQSDTNENTLNKIPTPLVRGTRKNLRVILPVPEQLLSLIPSKDGLNQVDPPSFRVSPVFFNVGINEEATLSAKLGKDKQQHALNQENFDLLFSYFSRYQTMCPEEDTRRNTLSGQSNRRKIKTLTDLVNDLKSCVALKKSKNVEILQVAAKICRRMGGIRLTSCKSAKDRTAMSVTLEQVNLLRQDFDLAENERKLALDCIRTEGVRLSNCKKNVSIPKYSFSSVQLSMFPAEYKPPPGTFAASIS